LLPIYSRKKICVIKATFEEFINAYKEWETLNNKNFVKSKGVFFTTAQESNVVLDYKILFRLSGNITQLNSKTQALKFVTKKDFYVGEEPSFQIINKNYDIEKKDKIKSIKKLIYNSIDKNNSKIVPIIF